MTNFEQRLQKTNSINRVLAMRPNKKDNLSEEECLELKAKYLCTSIDSVKFNVEKMRLYKVPFYKRFWKKLMRFALNIKELALAVIS